MKKLLLVLIWLSAAIISLKAQTLEKTWQFSSIENSEQLPIYTISKQDTLSLKGGEFSYSLKAKDNLIAEGDYIHQNNLLVFYYNQPNDTIRRYKITTLTDSTLVFEER